MKRSLDRILTTHAGSIPRPSRLHDLLIQRGDDEPVDTDLLAATVRDAVDAVVHRQHQVGLDVVDDG
jgi:5-methyltetrahydropteroyltriglutamate--homocysteine methyltransferase